MGISLPLRKAPNPSCEVFFGEGARCQLFVDDYGFGLLFYKVSESDYLRLHHRLV